jgi:hypothetical protein
MARRAIDSIWRARGYAYLYNRSVWLCMFVISYSRSMFAGELSKSRKL